MLQLISNESKNVSINDAFFQTDCVRCERAQHVFNISLSSTSNEDVKTSSFVYLRNILEGLSYLGTVESIDNHKH